MKRSLRCVALSVSCVVLLSVLSGCHKHVPGPEATCTEPQVCTECGEVLAEAKGHTPGPEATCAAPQTCTVCGEVLATVEHTPGPEATCTAPQTCTVCGEVLATVEHTPGPEATCTAPQTCTVCGEVLATVEHTPGPEATCTEPQVCTVCGEELTPAKGHDVGDDGVCTVCGKQINTPVGQYTPAGSGGAASADVIPETTPEGHYHNNISAYYSNSVLVCGDYALEFFNLGSDGNSSYAQILNDFAARYPGVNVTSVLVPKCCAFESPEGYKDPGPNARDYIANTYAMMDGTIKKADVFGIMSQHVGEYMFYRTDHHWTGLGAYYAYVAYCDANGLTAAPLSSYSTVINTGFIGTLYGYAGQPASLTANPDYTEGHLPQTGYRMSYCRGGNWYNATAINTGASSYAGMYIGGDQPLTVIETDLQNGKTVVVVKESYGNAFVPYLIDQYQRVVVLDIRESEGTMSEVMSEYDVTDVVVINNQQAAVSLQGSLRSKLMS
ncbi:MAG: hypothetical protein E7426_00550 [Ruminococcaceae bacterium]|nr:hypothetical protein [Oscillospiraceae bacterium]